MNAPIPGTLYERADNDGIRALILSASRPLDGGWLCDALLIDAAGEPLALSQIVLTLQDTPVYLRGATVDVVTHLANIRQQQIERCLTEKEAARAERLTTLYMKQAAYITRQLTRPAKATSSITDKERAEAKALGLSLPDVPVFVKQPPAVPCRCCGREMDAKWQEAIVKDKPGYWIVTCGGRRCPMKGFTFSSNCYAGVNLVDYLAKA